jgi:histidine triad (HIT) family protein
MNVFDRILNKEVPANVVFEDDACLAFHDIDPQAPIHVLVIPKKKCQSLHEIADNDAPYWGRYLAGIAQTVKILGLDGTPYQVLFNLGGEAVPYLHAHIVSGRALSWPAAQ